MPKTDFTRRGLILGGAASIGGLALTGCDRISQAPAFRTFSGGAEPLTLASQRLLLSGQPLAREFKPADLSPIFKVNGSRMPADPVYQAMIPSGFADWRLKVHGLVKNPLQLSLADLRALAARSQITRHDCVEGWSAIGQWTGVPLGTVLSTAGLLPNARYIVFHCADNLHGLGNYYESIDLFDAFHPQTILAYGMNGRPLEVPYGAPLRLRVERQLGYKQAKFIMRIEAAESLAAFGKGKGGFWEDVGYQWYAGIRQTVTYRRSLGDI